MGTTCLVPKRTFDHVTIGVLGSQLPGSSVVTWGPFSPWNFWRICVSRFTPMEGQPLRGSWWFQLLHVTSTWIYVAVLAIWWFVVYLVLTPLVSVQCRAVRSDMLYGLFSLFHARQVHPMASYLLLDASTGPQKDTASSRPGMHVAFCCASSWPRSVLGSKMQCKMNASWLIFSVLDALPTSFVFCSVLIFSGVLATTCPHSTFLQDEFFVPHLCRFD